MTLNFQRIAFPLMGLVCGSASAAITATKITNDADSGISSSITYTHKIDFSNSAPVSAAMVNGVTFDFSDGTTPGLNLTRTVTGGSATTNAGTPNVATTGNSAALFQGFLLIGGTPALDSFQTVTLSGLTAGTEYDFRIYAGRWRADTQQRFNTFTFDPDGAGAISDSTVSINEDNATALGFTSADAFYINYRYTAVANENLVVKINVDTATGGSWHIYAITNQVVPEPSSALLAMVGGLALLRRRR